jgi:hypothetical protein
MDMLSLRWNRRAVGINFIRLVVWLRTLLKPKSAPVNIDFDKLRAVNRLPLSSKYSLLKDCRALFVVTSKDFRTLPLAISYLSKNTGIELTAIDVVTPKRYLIECKEILQSNGLAACNIIDENVIVPIGNLTTLREKSSDRFGWIYQQLLKIYSCYGSGAEYTLICDADTILLNRRRWSIDTSTVLMPSLEFNEEYYRFLNRAFGFEENPKYSFVAHHMLVKNSHIKSFLKSNEVDSISKFVSAFEENADFTNPSMASIDYELYAQFMWNQLPSEVFLEKWSNINLSASLFNVFNSSKIFRYFLAKNYQSVSFHSWS